MRTRARRRLSLMAGAIALGLLGTGLTATTASAAVPCGPGAVGGSILVHWQRLPLETKNRLGCSMTWELNHPHIAGARYNQFRNGYIVWTPRTGAYEVHGEIYRNYRFGGGGFHGSERWLGAPVTDEHATPRRYGAYNHFERGSIYWSPRTGAWPVVGAIREHWARSGWENGRYGFPIGPEFAPHILGRPAERATQAFEHCVTLVWTRRTGAVTEERRC